MYKSIYDYAKLSDLSLALDNYFGYDVVAEHDKLIIQLEMVLCELIDKYNLIHSTHSYYEYNYNPKWTKKHFYVIHIPISDNYTNTYHYQHELKYKALLGVISRLMPLI